MTELFFNPKDTKYKCCLELFHVKTGATLICLLAALLHLLFAYDVYSDFEQFKPVWIWFLYISLYVFCYVFALFGINYSKPEFINLAVVFTRVRIIIFGAFTLHLLGALFPSISVKQFCRYLVKLLLCDVKDKDETIFTLVLGIVLLQCAVQIVADSCVYYILKNCRQYYTDKAAYDKLTLPKSKVLLPPYEV